MLEQVEFAGAGNCLSAVDDSEFSKEMFDMNFDCVQADHQLLRDLLI